MKKTYIKPVTIQFKIEGNQALLQASFNENLGSHGVSGNEALGRGGNLFWDDDDDEQF